MKIDNHISELLYCHDCVIVPGFGGFIGNYQPARIHPTQHTFYPPSKKISFNKNLLLNDGLLANHIALRESASYPEAVRQIGAYVSGAQTELDKGARFAIEKVGVLYYDPEKNLRFEADLSVNYLEDSFGMGLIQSPPIRREGFRKTEKRFTDRPLIEPARRRTWVRKHGWKVAAIVPVAAFSIWLSINTTLFSRLNISYGNLNLFHDTALPVKQTPPVPVHETAPPPAPSFVNDSASALPAAADTTATAPADVPPPAIESPGKNFLVIAGCFAVPGNAEKYVKVLRDKGYPASINGTNGAGLTMVAFNSFEGREEAVLELARIKAEYDSTAWLFVR